MISVHLAKLNNPDSLTHISDEDGEVVIGISRDDNDKLMALTIHPDGTFTFDFGTLGGNDTSETQYLGKIYHDGTLTINEPFPVSQMNFER